MVVSVGEVLVGEVSAGVVPVMLSTTSFSWWLSSRTCSVAYATVFISALAVDRMTVDCFFDFH